MLQQVLMRAQRCFWTVLKVPYRRIASYAQQSANFISCVAVVYRQRSIVNIWQATDGAQSTLFRVHPLVVNDCYSVFLPQAALSSAFRIFVVQSGLGLLAFWVKEHSYLCISLVLFFTSLLSTVLAFLFQYVRFAIVGLPFSASVQRFEVGGNADPGTLSTRRSRSPSSIGVEVHRANAFQLAAGSTVRFFDRPISNLNLGRAGWVAQDLIARLAAFKGTKPSGGNNQIASQRDNQAVRTNFSRYNDFRQGVFSCDGNAFWLGSFTVQPVCGPLVF